MRIQTTFIEQIKDSSTPLNSPEPSQGILGLGRGGAAGKRGTIFSAGPAKGKVGRESYRERSWAYITRPLLLSFFAGSKLKVAQTEQWHCHHPSPRSLLRAKRSDAWC